MATNIIEINGTIDSWGWQRSNIKYQLSNLKGKDATVRIMSLGGDVNEAMKISQLFADHGNVTVQFLGMVASSATWMAYGANKVQMAEDALWLCHKTSTVLDIYKALNADQIQQKIDELQKAKKTNEALDLIIAKKYAEHSGQKLSDMLDLMKEEKWLTSKDAKAKGLIDEVIKASGSIKNQHELIIQNCADLNLPTPQFSDIQEQKDTLIDIVINKCKELFQPKGGVPASQFHDLHLSAEDDGEGNIVDDAADADKNINNNKQQLMNKTFTAVNTLLNIEGVTETEGKVTLTVDQMTAICNALNEKKQSDAQLTKVAEVLDKFEDNKSITGIENKAQCLINLINRIPLVAQTPEDKGNHEDTYKVENADPINSVRE